MEEELRFHIDQHIALAIERGLTPDDARREAVRTFGGLTQIKEECRDMTKLNLLENLAQDLRFAGRMMAKSPAFTTVAVLSLALGIGANAAIFSAIDAFLLRPLPVAQPERLVTLEQVFPDGRRQYNFSYPDYERFQALRSVFSGLAATSWSDAYNVAPAGTVNTDDDSPARVSIVTGNYFSVLGVNARLGRTLTEDDDHEGSRPAAVISAAYWDRNFARSRDVLGRTLSLGGVSYTIVGMMPPGFAGDWVGYSTDIWAAVAMLPQMSAESRAGLPRGANSQYKIIARRAPGVTLAQAQAAGDVVFRRLQQDAPANTGVSRNARFQAVSAATGYSPQREVLQQPLTILLVLVGAVLLIACANVANLLIARSAARQREISVRLAIGAGRARIIRQLLTESTLLALLGSAFGLAFANWGTTLLATLVRSGPVDTGIVSVGSIVLDMHPDTRILGFTLALGLLTGLLFGLAPAWRAAQTSLAPALSARGITAGNGGLRKVLVALQVALSLAMLVATGLLVRTLANLKSGDLGFDREHVLLVWTFPAQTGRRGGELAALWETAQNQISSISGVISASASVEGLLPGAATGGPLLRVEGSSANPADDDRVRGTSTVGPRFFQTVGQTLIAGREFTARDTDAASPVTIVNQSLARHFFGSQSALGRRLQIGSGRSAFSMQIVGVVSDARQTPRAPSGMMLYYPPGQNLRRLARSMCLVVRVAGNPANLAAQIRQRLHAIDPRLPIARIETVSDQLDRVLFQERMVASLSAFFGLLAIGLESLGLYGVFSYMVTRRTNEIGVRLALGATRSEVVAMVFQSSFLLVLAGIAGGIPLTIALVRLISTRLYGVTSTDPLTVAAVALLMFGVATIATLVPAYRASRIDPTAALRYE